MLLRTVARAIVVSTLAFSVACATGTTDEREVAALEGTSAADAGSDATDATLSVFGSSDADTNTCLDNPKYAARYQQAVAMSTVKACSVGCSSTECCYGRVACVER